MSSKIDKYTVEQIKVLIASMDIGDFIDEALEVVYERTGEVIGEEHEEGFREGAFVVKQSLVEALDELVGKL